MTNQLAYEEKCEQKCSARWHTYLYVDDTHGGGTSSEIVATKGEAKASPSITPPSLCHPLDRHTLQHHAFFGLSCAPRGALLIFSAISCPSTTSPKIVCLPVSHSVFAVVMKNCEPFVFGPAFAIASLPGLPKRWGEPLVSSSNLISGTAHAVARRVAALDHEVGNHAVEDRAVVELVARLRARRGCVHSRLPSASSMKLATVFGASFSNSRATMVPSLVFNVA